MKPEEFILWLKGYLDGLENNLPQSKGLEATTLSPGLLTIKTKLSHVSTKTIDFNPPPYQNPYKGPCPPKNPYEIYCDGTTGGSSTTVTYDFVREKNLIKG